MDIEKLFITNVVCFGGLFAGIGTYFYLLYDSKREIIKEIAEEEEAEKKFQLAYEKSFSLKMKEIESLYK